MTGEQMERAIEFLLDHQAQFAADISILKESQAETRKNIDRITVKIDDLVARVDDITKAQARTQTLIDKTQVQIDKTQEQLDKTQVQIDKTQEQMNYLTKQQARTSGELEHFMIAMQGFVTEVRNKLDK